MTWEIILILALGLESLAALLYSREVERSDCTFKFLTIEFGTVEFTDASQGSLTQVAQCG